MSCCVRYRPDTTLRLTMSESGLLTVLAISESQWGAQKIYPPGSDVEESITDTERLLDSWVATGEIPESYN